MTVLNYNDWKTGESHCIGTFSQIFHSLLYYLLCDGEWRCQRATTPKSGVVNTEYLQDQKQDFQLWLSCFPEPIRVLWERFTKPHGAKSEEKIKAIDTATKHSAWLVWHYLHTVVVALTINQIIGYELTCTCSDQWFSVARGMWKDYRVSKLRNLESWVKIWLKTCIHTLSQLGEMVVL